MKTYFPVLAASALAFLAWATPVLADPCEGALPAKGTRFSGVVRYIGEGDSLCIGTAAQPARWIEIRLADYYAPELHDKGGADAKRRLERITMGKTLVCKAGRRSYDRIIAACMLGGQSIGSLLRANGGIEGGRGWPR